MRVRTAFTVVLLSGLACFCVPSAAANQLPSTSAETIAVAAPVDAPAVEPTQESSEVPTDEVTPPEADESAAPTEGPVELSKDESPTASERVAGEPTGAVDATVPAEDPDDPQAAANAEAPPPLRAAVAESPLAAMPVVRDPRASVHHVNCTNMTLDVVLDNSQSTMPVGFTVVVGSDDAVEHTVEETIQAGGGQIVYLPVTEDAEVTVSILDQSGPEHLLAFAVLQVDCKADDDPHDPQVLIESLDCESSTVEVTLDNSRSQDETTFRVTARTVPDGTETSNRTIDVPAGGMWMLWVSAAEDSSVLVSVVDQGVMDETAGEDGELALKLFRVNCKTGRVARASVGELNCTNLTVSVTLDNTRVQWPMTFAVGAVNFQGAQRYYAKLHDVAAGAERVVAVPVPNHAEIFVFVGDQYLLENDSVIYDHETFDVDCQRPAGGHAARPTVAVEWAKLPQTGGFNFALPLLGGALLAGGAGMLALSGRRPRH
jgi:LPXTG-motif cell wall-anchored protein